MIIGSGTSTAFWLDLWIPQHNTTLATQFLALFSHSTRPNASVARVLSLPLLNLDLMPCLTHAAGHELSIIWDIVAVFVLNE